MKIFFNARGKRDGLSLELANYLDYVSGKNANDDFTRSLDDSVKKVKQDRRKKVDFMTWQQYIIEERYDAREEGRAEGRAEAEAEIMKLKQELEQLRQQLKCD